MISNFRSYGSGMTYINLVFPIGWLIPGIVYLTGLLLLIPLTHLKLDWINFGTVKILYMILEHSSRESEVVVKCCVRSNLVYCKVISRCGHRGFGLRLSTPSTSTSASKIIVTDLIPKGMQFPWRHAAFWDIVRLNQFRNAFCDLVQTRAHLSGDEIPERDVTYYLMWLLIYHSTTTHL